VRGYAREKKMPWTRGVWVSKQDHRVVAEHELSPGETQPARAGAVNAGSMRGSSGDGGATWGKQERASAGSGRRQQGRGGHMAWLRAALGWWVHGTRLARAAVMHRQRNRNRGVRGWRRKTRTDS
jgi:hypothetical protein